MIGRMLGVAVTSQLRGVVRPTAATVLLMTGAAMLSERVHVGSWLTLVLVCLVTVVACTAFALVAGVPARRRRALIQRVRRVAQLT